MQNPFEVALPVDCFVRAFRDGEMWAGMVASHSPEEGYLTVRFSNGICEKFAYVEIDLENPSESMVIYQFNGGLAGNILESKEGV